MSLVPTRALLCGCLFVGCSGPAAPIAEEPISAVAAPSPPAATIVAEAAVAPVPAPAPVVAAEVKVGVEACDGYADRYRACIAEQVPAIEKERHSGVLAAQLKTWLAAAADPKLAPGLGGECAAAAEAARASTRILGCVWHEGDTSAPERVKGGTLKPEVRSSPRGMEAPFPRPGDPLSGL